MTLGSSTSPARPSAPTGAPCLRSLLDGVEVVRLDGKADVAVAGVTENSRQVKPHDLFVAVRGAHVDGHLFIDDALAAGAAAIVCEIADRPLPRATRVLVSDSRRAMARIARNFYRDPAASMRVVGITGTNGKTTVAYLVRNILIASGARTGLVSTIEYRTNGRAIPAERTTPDPVMLFGLLRQMADAGCDAVVTEVSSHALEQCRVEGLRFDIGVFTNLTQDHLDYHGDMDRYLRAKTRLFSSMRPGPSDPFARTAVVNVDDHAAPKILDAACVPVLSYAIDTNADCRAHQVRLCMSETRFVAATPLGALPIRSTLLGRHNVYNILAALGVASACDIPAETVRAAIERTQPVAGRLQFIPNRRQLHVVVDYAHTDDALKNVITTLREIAPGRLIVVFGCGGDRDPTKRPKMGRVVSERSSLAVITSDNPRSEDPEAIIREVVEGAKAGGGPYVTITDRREAIAYALNEAQPGDTVLIAGKGHETYQQFKHHTLEFDDREVARELLGEK